MSSAPRLSVVIPVYNEEAIIEQAATELVNALDARGWNYEILFAENGSTDATPQLLAKLHEKLPKTRFLRSPEPNYGAALKAGILDARGTYIVCDEIDLCDVSFYDVAVPRLERGEVDLLVGSKAARGASDQRPLLRRVATRVHNGVLRVALGFKGTDTHGLKAFHREKMLPYIEACVVDRDVFASEMVIRAWRSDLKVAEIPIQLREKRKPSVHLFQRVPNVLKQVGKLVYVIRVKGR